MGNTNRAALKLLTSSQLRNLVFTAGADVADMADAILVERYLMAQVRG